MDELRELLATPLARAVVAVAVLAILIAMGVYLSAWSRQWAQAYGRSADDDSLLLDEYRHAYEQGLLTRKEFDRIKARLRESMLTKVDARLADATLPPEDKTGRDKPGGGDKPTPAPLAHAVEAQRRKIDEAATAGAAPPEDNAAEATSRPTESSRGGSTST